MKKLLTFLLLALATSVGAQEISEEKAATEKNPPPIVAGSVTSVNCAGDGTILSCPGGPITTSGSFTLTFSTQIKNKIFAGPASGADAVPTFRIMVPDDWATGSSSGWVSYQSGGVNGWVPSSSLSSVTRNGFTCGWEGFYIATQTYIGTCFLAFVANSGTGTGAFQAVTGTAARPGQAQLDTGAGTSQPSISGIGNSGTQVLFGGGTWEFGAGMKLSAVSDGTNTYTVRMGWKDTDYTTDNTDGLFLKYTDSVNGGKWQLVASNNSAQVTCDTTVAAESTGFHFFKITVNAAGSSATGTVDDVGCTINSGIPTSAGRETTLLPFSINKSAGATARDLIMDFYYYTFQATTPR